MNDDKFIITPQPIHSTFNSTNNLDKATTKNKDLHFENISEKAKSTTSKIVPFSTLEPNILSSQNVPVTTSTFENQGIRTVGSIGVEFTQTSIKNNKVQSIQTTQRRPKTLTGSLNNQNLVSESTESLSNELEKPTVSKGKFRPPTMLYYGFKPLFLNQENNDLKPRPVTFMKAGPFIPPKKYFYGFKPIYKDQLNKSP